jgi:hypothetical protein
MGIGISTFTEIVGAGPSNTFDILGIKMFDSAEIRVHPTGSAIVRIGVQTQGQGHETTFAQIVAEELGLSVENIEVEHGDTDTAPYGLGTYASRSTPTAGAATAMAARKIRDKAAHLAAHVLECAVDDLEWKDYQFQVKGAPERSKTMTDLAFAAYTNHPQGMEAGLEAVCYYDPPNLTFPFGAYIAVVDIDRGTGEVHVRRFVAIDGAARSSTMVVGDRSTVADDSRPRCTSRSGTTSRATSTAARSWTTWCRPRWRRPPGRPSAPSRRRRITRSGRRVWANRRPSARRRRLSTRSSMRCPTSG